MSGPSSGTGLARIRRELPRHPARRQLCVDAFVLEVRGLDYHRDLPALAATLRRVLRCLCDHDPAHAQSRHLL